MFYVLFYTSSPSVDGKAGRARPDQDLPGRPADERGRARGTAGVAAPAPRPRAAAAAGRHAVAAAGRGPGRRRRGSTGMQHDSQAQGDSAAC